MQNDGTAVDDRWQWLEEADARTHVALFDANLALRFSQRIFGSLSVR